VGQALGRVLLGEPVSGGLGRDGKKKKMGVVFRSPYLRGDNKLLWKANWGPLRILSSADLEEAYRLVQKGKKKRV